MPFKPSNMKQFLFSLSLFLFSALATDLPTLPAKIEVDVLFPRNDTYGRVDNFPVIFAIQNAVLAWDFGFWVGWTMTNVTSGATSSSSSGFIAGETMVHGNMPKQAAPADPFFLANYTYRLGGPYTHGAGTYRLSWYFSFVDNCTTGGGWTNHTFGAVQADGDLVFTIADAGKPIDLTDNGPCPVAGGIVGIQSNVTGCPHVDNTGFQAEPCNVRIDDTLAKSLLAQLPPITVSTSSSSTKSGTSKTTGTVSGTSSVTGTRTSSSTTTTTATGNNAPGNGKAQATAVVLAGLVGFCAVIV